MHYAAIPENTHNYLPCELEQFLHPHLDITADKTVPKKANNATPTGTPIAII